MSRNWTNEALLRLPRTCSKCQDAPVISSPFLPIFLLRIGEGKLSYIFKEIFSFKCLDFTPTLFQWHQACTMVRLEKSPTKHSSPGWNTLLFNERSPGFLEPTSGRSFKSEFADLCAGAGGHSSPGSADTCPSSVLHNWRECPYFLWAPFTGTLMRSNRYSCSPYPQWLEHSLCYCNIHLN